MLRNRKQLYAFILLFFSGLGFSPQLKAEVDQSAVKSVYHGCSHIKDLTVPLDFIAYLQSRITKDFGLSRTRSHFRPVNSNFQNSEWMAKIPDLKDRLVRWRIFTGRSFDGSGDECLTLAPVTENITQPPDVLAGALVAALPLRPQHSLAKSIFRKRKITLQIFDSSTVDGDIVDVIFNNHLIKNNLTLKGFPGTSVTVTLSPSALLPKHVNQLRFRGVSNGASGKTSPGVALAPARANTIFRGGPALDVFPKIIEINDPQTTDGLSAGTLSQPINIALGLVCFDPFLPRQAQSTKHAKDALARIPDSKGRIRPVRIVTVDRLGAKARGDASVKGYPTRVGFDRDEYPPKIFVENAGLAHVRLIPLSDNRSFGAYLKNTITGPVAAKPLYKNSDQLELVVAPRNNLHGTFYCKNAW